MKIFTLILLFTLLACTTQKKTHNDWLCHTIQADPKNHGPDGINFHDWDGDGHTDILANFEEGKVSRLYFNPGKEQLRGLWTHSIEFKHGQCEDSAIGDLDNDGDIDYIANGGWVYFNPGKESVKEASKWQVMTLSKKEGRVPIVVDMDGDGLNDLLVAGSYWYKQPQAGKRNANNWQKFIIGKADWPMNSIIYDVDKDGLKDIVVQDRKNEIFWMQNPGLDKVTQTWPRFSLYQNKQSMFMIIADVNKDGMDDFIITGGRVGTLKKKLLILLRTNKTGKPEFKTLILDQPKMVYSNDPDFFPKGVARIDMNGDKHKDIVILPKKGDFWYATYKGDSFQKKNWQTTSVSTPKSLTRKKMDNIYLNDIDHDGDLDFATTEENGGWGVIWFENPEIQK
jgi:hypothetical protein